MLIWGKGRYRTRLAETPQDLDVSFHDDGSDKPLSEELRVIGFRAVRELLVNIRKHASARHAGVSIARDGGVVMLFR